MALPKSVKRWSFYTFANHSYLVAVVAFLLPLLFSGTLLAKGFSLEAWGIANGVSTVLGVALAILVGRYSDRHSKLRAFQWSIALSFLGMLSLSFWAQYPVAWFYGLFVATNAVFIWSLSLSDSILPHVSDHDTVYSYGGFAWAMGYAGGLASLLLVLVLQYFTGTFSFFVFLAMPIFYLAFSWYSVSGLSEVPLNEPAPAAPQAPVIAPKEKAKLFLGYWLISECVTVISLFAATFLSGELHFSAMQVGLSFVAIEIIGFPATWYGGTLVRRYGSLRLLGLSIVIWGAAMFVFIFWHAGLVSLGLALLLFGMVYGNSQSFLRSQYATLVPRSESGFQFGWYAVISEAAVFIGPVLYGYASDQLHSQKIPLLALFVCMVAGYAIVWKIMHGREAAMTPRV
jgi:UMF1 family MFS transporter